MKQYNLHTKAGLKDFCEDLGIQQRLAHKTMNAFLLEYRRLNNK